MLQEILFYLREHHISPNDNDLNNEEINNEEINEDEINDDDIIEEIIEDEINDDDIIEEISDTSDEESSDTIYKQYTKTISDMNKKYKTKGKRKYSDFLGLNDDIESISDDEIMLYSSE